ncbi:F-box protein At2g26160-like isoform X3 [Carica papaya]|uniref:F-box protein At2g26160-like isoform X3 n=2 Tax=Carica papaya TaxID=3649 RepID=UPI000B8CA0A6|nr:F-box protein At2g26160-like isoform X3 [Carica papaya]
MGFWELSNPQDKSRREMEDKEDRLIGIRSDLYFPICRDRDEDAGAMLKRDGNSNSKNSKASTSKGNNSKDDNSKGDIQSCKKPRVSPGDEMPPWTELPGDLLYVISKQLSIQDYFSFGQVCTKWRSNFAVSKKAILTSIPPLLLLLSPYRPEFCYFYNLSDGSIFEIKIPSISMKLFHGVSSGYLVMESLENDIWLTNPITRQHLVVTKPPEYTKLNKIFDLLIIALVIPQKEILMVGLTKRCLQLWFRRSTDSRWTSCEYGEDKCFLDLIVFNFKVYVLGTDCEIGFLNLKSTPCLTFLPLNGKPGSSRHSRFVTSGDRLLVVDFLLERWLCVYEIDLVKMEWVKITDLGDESLFFSSSKGNRLFSSAKGSRLLNPKKWGGHSNCLYQLEFMLNKCHVYSLERELVGEYIINVNSYNLYPFGWYFPESAYDMDVVRDDE